MTMMTTMARGGGAERIPAPSASSRSALLLSLFVLLPVVAACGGEPGEDAGEGADLEMETVEFAPELNVTLDEMDRRPSGVYVEELESGDGAEAREGSSVTVHYTGWLPDGTRFDSSREAGEPFTFVIGRQQVIPGWEEGVTGMRAGSVRRLVIPPELAYGAQGAGNVIPPNSPLVFEVEVLEVESSSAGDTPDGASSGEAGPGSEIAGAG